MRSYIKVATPPQPRVVTSWPTSRLIDTPGIRELGVHLDTPIDAALHYPDIAALHPQCHYPDCSHTHEPDCAVKAAVQTGELARSRYASYLALLENDLGLDVGSARAALGIAMEGEVTRTQTSDGCQLAKSLNL